MRLKLSKQNSKEYTCCCCHVRTGTIILGCFQLITSLLLVFCLTVAFFYPELVPTKYQSSFVSKYPGTEDDQFAPKEVTSTSQPKDGADSAQADYPNMYDWNWVSDKDGSSYENQCFGLFVTFLTLIATMMLVYGAVRGIASFLMPYFVLQVFDFALSCLTILGYFSTVVDVKIFLTQLANKMDWPAEWRESLLGLDSHWLTLIVASFVLVYLVIKAYLINVVYSCYKYLAYVQASQRAGRDITHYMESGETDDSQLLLPPKYEEVINSEQPAPPPYSAA